MKIGKAPLNLILFTSISIMVTIIFYFVNIWLFSSFTYFSPTDALFFEGVLFLILGVLLLLGKGGINLWSVRAAILSALTGVMYRDKDTVGPSETMRQDQWKPEGFTRFALILMLTGVFMILAYFLTL